jgi:phospholipid/cholesterol/gamma-HCH transport system substrate-binding protein
MSRGLFARKRLLPVGKRKLTPATIGIALSLTVVLVGLGLFNKGRIINAVTAGEVVEINFARDYKLREFVSAVKVAGVPVGKVQSIDRRDDGTAMVEVKIDASVRDRLGSAPSAAIRPTTLLGGFYYVELIPGGVGGEFGGSIPVNRTIVPVELDGVARALQPAALEGIRSSVLNLDGALNQGGTEAIDRLLADAPAALAPSRPVFESLLGTDRRKDLPRLVRNLESTARVLTAKQGQLDTIVRNLASTSDIVGARSVDVTETIRQLPVTLDSADVGLARLDTTLHELEEAAEPARAVVRELDSTLERLEPVLVKARPLVSDLAGVLSDAKPVVRDLVPISQRGTGVVNNLRGPVLDRLNGPLKTFLHSPYNGKGMYAGSGSDQPVYQEVGFLFANLLREVATADRNGHFLNVHAGVGPGSAVGLPISLEQLVPHLTQLQINNSQGGSR